MNIWLFYTMRHCNDVIMNTMACQIHSLTIVYSTVYSRHRSKKTSKLCVTGICEGNSPVPGEFPTQRASNTANVSIWWRHHDIIWNCLPDVFLPSTITLRIILPYRLFMTNFIQTSDSVSTDAYQIPKNGFHCTIPNMYCHQTVKTNLDSVFPRCWRLCNSFT